MTKLRKAIDGDALEIELVEALRREARLGNVKAAKFLLVNLWPERWAEKPDPGKPGALEPGRRRARITATDADRVVDPSTGLLRSGAPPFRFRLYEKNATPA